jgi:hypothetical protein
VATNSTLSPAISICQRHRIQVDSALCPPPRGSCVRMISKLRFLSLFTVRCESGTAFTYHPNAPVHSRGDWREPRQNATASRRVEEPGGGSDINTPTSCTRPRQPITVPATGFFTVAPVDAAAAIAALPSGSAALRLKRFGPQRLSQNRLDTRLIRLCPSSCHVHRQRQSRL